MKNILFISIMFFGISLSAQQAWTQKKSEGYFQIGSSFLSYSELYNLTSDAIELPRPITELIISSYLEYGISGKIMLDKCQKCGMIRATKDLVLDTDNFYICFSCWNKIHRKRGEKSEH